MGVVGFDADRGVAVAGTQSGDRVCEANDGFDSSFRPRLTVCEYCLQ
ncbi:hypothetical protein FRC0190_00738 [Corynebacterium rouxii]|uniref:Uncharacterized protein n=1 Tax=Corynebacterium rouxii TaxID=2719119 RepID=A0A6I8MGQ7_9CORY|nr:hypothetical protein FRC0190_00738 [Corynebacterium rouxii]